MALEKLQITIIFISFNNVPTWHGWQKVMEVLLFQFYVHFIGRKCMWVLREFRSSLSCNM
jgi:hypothetical protein